MKNHQLEANEIVRYQAQITLQTEKGDILAGLILTNLNFIFVTERKNFLWIKRKPLHTAYAKELVKVDRDAPQIKQTGTSVTICFADKDRVLVFNDRKEARDFVINAWETVTGKNVFERTIDKLKQALDCIDDILQFDIREIIKGALESRVALGNNIGKAVMNFLPKKKDK